MTSKASTGNRALKKTQPPSTDNGSPLPDATGKVEKLQKSLARAGLGSRREMERWIEQGRFAIGGRRAQLGDRLFPGERVTLDGKPVDLETVEQVRCLLYHKPVGEVCSRKDPELSLIHI